MLSGVKHTAGWRLARGLKRAAFPPVSDGVLPTADCRSEVVYLDPPAALEAGAAFRGRFRLTNRSGVAWASRGGRPIVFRARWRTHAGEVFGCDTTSPLPRPVYPGEPAEIELPLTAPEFVGDFLLEADLAQGDAAFTDRNPDAVAARVAIPVQGRRATDIDYHAVYRTADLAANHWWVVGAYHSKEQYERSSRDRLGMLREHARLSPDSRVLDVGCGTGQMAGALESYLSDRGAYYGTDIGKEAVAFCDRTFRRRNFVFRQGGMTRVPFDAGDGPFDLAIFFSVFTHTFVDESALLLAETGRLLAPGGAVVADVITSPLVERAAGHRGEMVVNRDHFLRLAGMLGFVGDVIGRWDWSPHAERLMFRFTRAT